MLPSRIINNLNTPWWPAVIALFVYSMFAWMHLAQFGYDASRFVVAGDKYVSRAAAPADLDIRRQSNGYDGQFYYRLAINPFTRDRTADGITFDNPAYRQQRIVYPTLAWLLSGGQPSSIPTVLIMINLVAIGAMGWLAGRLAQSFGRPAMWGMLVMLYPGFLITVSRDLTEILSTVWLLAGLLSWQRGRMLTSAGWFTLAALTRESTLIAVAAIGIQTVMRWRQTRRFDIRTWVPIAMPLLVYAAWYVYLTWQWGSTPTSGNVTTLGLGFGVMADTLRVVLTSTATYDRVMLLNFLLIGFLTIAAFASMRRSAVGLAVKCAWVLYLALAIFLTQSWQDDTGFLRALTEMAIFAVLIVMAAPGKLKMFLAGSMVLQWLLVALYTTRLNY